MLFSGKMVVWNMSQTLFSLSPAPSLLTHGHSFACSHPTGKHTLFFYHSGSNTWHVVCILCKFTEVEKSNLVRTCSSILHLRNLTIFAANSLQKKKKKTFSESWFSKKSEAEFRHTEGGLFPEIMYIRNAKYSLLHWAAWRKHERVCLLAAFLRYQSYCFFFPPEKLCLLEKDIFLNYFLFLGCCTRNAMNPVT